MASLFGLPALVILATTLGVGGLRDRRPLATQSDGSTINFLFLLRGSLPHADIWLTFFDAAPPDSWRAWAHCTNFEACRADEALLTLGVTVVPTVPSRWCDDLVTAQAHLVAAALAGGSGLRAPAAADRFVLLSDTTLPIKPFASMQQGLLATDSSSVCMRPVREWPAATINGTEFRLVKHSQWVVLSRRDAEEFVRRWPVKPELNGWDIPAMGADGRGDWSRSMSRSAFLPLDGVKSRSGRCPDEEAVFALLFGAPMSGEVASVWNRSRCHTYIEWKGTFLLLHGITPRVFSRVEEETMNAAQPHTSFFFARKFSPTAEVREILKLILAAPVQGQRLTTAHGLLDRWGLEPPGVPAGRV
uniref:Protein xylosyltransferase n=1 Tax=Alexandrium monilatum TaxID=311494 RepID=A0A7S4T0D1_9DINO|mmetsp:Transcript_4120/g.13090  ORF Transcript_4120/g.13090 Transcript_4120/m.13090 type:complete len:360 (+) Transcript_4120:62-1141(+)